MFASVRIIEPYSSRCSSSGERPRTDRSVHYERFTAFDALACVHLDIPPDGRGEPASPGLPERARTE